MNAPVWDVVIVGSGLAGLTTALALQPLRTLVLSKTDSLVGGSSPLAQGGVAIPTSETDIPLHIHDTLVSGAGHCDPQAVEFLIQQAPQALNWLETQGVLFDRDTQGVYLRSQEGAHSERRVLHCGADATGAGLIDQLLAQARRADWIQLQAQTMVVSLVPGGLWAIQPEEGLQFIPAARVVLAGGGVGQAFAYTTAPAEATGDALALAAAAGIDLLDLEMIQFHPTALFVPPKLGNSWSLLTEALRGEGARLVTTHPDRPQEIVDLPIDHPQASLGPRDVLARAVFLRRQLGAPVWLDARHLSAIESRFPTVLRLCQAADLHPQRDLLPVTPAAHYTMGGIPTDLAGRTIINSIYAVGECARTGVHGANRLASNSLLECLVFGQAAAADILKHPPVASSRHPLATPPKTIENPPAIQLPGPSFDPQLRQEIAQLVFQSAGPIRDQAGLRHGLAELIRLRQHWQTLCQNGAPLTELPYSAARLQLETQNLLTLAPLILTQALQRTTSLGAHYRSDAPGGPPSSWTE